MTDILSALAEEKWRPVEWAPDYEVSTLGRVRSVDRVVFTSANGPDKTRSRGSFFTLRRGKILKPGLGRYARVSVNGKQCSVHRLVAEAFIGPCPEGYVVCHGSGGPFDNSVENLYYGTVSTNNGHDRRRDGTIPRGEKSGNSKLTEAEVLDIKRRTKAGESRASIARSYGVRPENISHIALGRTWGWLTLED